MRKVKMLLLEISLVGLLILASMSMAFAQQRLGGQVTNSTSSTQNVNITICTQYNDISSETCYATNWQVSNIQPGQTVRFEGNVPPHRVTRIKVYDPRTNKEWNFNYGGGIYELR